MSVWREISWISVSVFVAMILTILPMPGWAQLIMPMWVFVVLLFWLLYLPDRIGPVWVFVIGLYMDLLTGSVLGQHAFIYVVFAYMTQRLLRLIRAMPLWQQMLGVGGYSIGAVIIAALFGYWHHQISWQAVAFWPVLTNMLLWPLLYFLCRDSQPHHDYTFLQR